MRNDRLEVVRPERQCPLRACERLVHTSELCQHQGAVVQGICEIGLDPQRRIIGSERLVMASERKQRIAAIAQSVEETGPALSAWS